MADSGGWSVIAFTQPHQEGGDDLLVDLVEVGDTTLVEEVGVPPQVAAVRRQGVRSQPTLDGQVIEVGPQREGKVGHDAPGRGA